MAIHLHFNKSDCPQNMGQLQKLSPEQTIKEWLNEVKAHLPNAKIEGDRLTFDVTEEVDGEEEIYRGYALITEVPDDFEN